MRLLQATALVSPLFTEIMLTNDVDPSPASSLLLLGSLIKRCRSLICALLSQCKCKCEATRSARDGWQVQTLKCRPQPSAFAMDFAGSEASSSLVSSLTAFWSSNTIQRLLPQVVMTPHIHSNLASALPPDEMIFPSLQDYKTRLVIWRSRKCCALTRGQSNGSMQCHGQQVKAISAPPFLAEQVCCNAQSS